MAKLIELGMGNFVRSLTLSVRISGQKRAAARIWIGAQIIKLAALAIGCSVEIEVEKR
ncbi:hypothetical protein [Sphingomonas sanxanigenens]|uniref:Uncharacterized protein n=1 Tax=Sphingomonas sanxanigenens DSM 19645 = NX02 TaxID=1123269 RepID=W0A3V6_9SPHN|nr:hypothetical protein [Sphingomonas sanxanigenens]AHE52634.1 hypothetical protein NX02_04450 [Sphingomonas sanxanigenens DSM 19645 = NX02]